MLLVSPFRRLTAQPAGLAQPPGLSRVAMNDTANGGVALDCARHLCGNSGNGAKRSEEKNGAGERG